MSIFSKLFGSSNQGNPNTPKYDLENSLDVAYLLGVLARQIIDSGSVFVGGDLNKTGIIISIHCYESYVNLTNPSSQLKSLEFIQKAGLRNGKYLTQISYEPSPSNDIKVRIPMMCSSNRVKEIAEAFERGCNSYTTINPVVLKKDRNNATSCSYSADIN